MPTPAASGGVPACHKGRGSRAQAVRARGRAGLLVCGRLPCGRSGQHCLRAWPSLAVLGLVPWALGGGGRCQSSEPGHWGRAGAQHTSRTASGSPRRAGPLRRPQPPGSLRVSPIVSSRALRAGGESVRRGSVPLPSWLPGCPPRPLPLSSPGSTERGLTGGGRDVGGALWSPSAPGVRSQVLAGLSVGLFLRMALGGWRRFSRPGLLCPRPPGGQGPLHCSPCSH